MRYVILLLFPLSLFAQKDTTYKGLFNGNSIATYSLFFAGGFSDGLNDCVIALKFYNDPFWGYKAWLQRGNIDGFHMTKLATPVFYCAAIAINLGEKRNWKYYAAKGLISFAASRAGHELCYQVIFRNYPK